jgi:hypothetical protein
MLPMANITRCCYFSFRVNPHVQPGALVSQRLHVAVNGYPVAKFSVTQRQVVAGLINRGFVKMKAATFVRLAHPDNARPVDFPEACSGDQRALAIAYEEFTFEELNDVEEALASSIADALEVKAVPVGQRRNSVSPDPGCDHGPGDVLQHFQSAGDDCEFGFVQREFGLEPLGLLRFASISIDDLTRGLRAGFDGIGDLNSLDVFVPDNAPNHDYMVRAGLYGLTYHTGVLPLSISAEELRMKESARLRRLAEKLLEDIRLGEKIFVIKYKALPVPVQVARLLAAIRNVGDATVCWVMEARDPTMVGSAEWLLPGLIVGYVDRIDVAPLQDISLRSWLEVCRAAHRLWAAHRRK